VGQNDEITSLGVRHPVTPNRLEFSCFGFSSSRPLIGRSWTATLLIYYLRTLLCSLPFFRLLILLLLLVSGNVNPNLDPYSVKPLQEVGPLHLLQAL